MTDSYEVPRSLVPLDPANFTNVWRGRLQFAMTDITRGKIIGHRISIVPKTVMFLGFVTDVDGGSFVLGLFK